MNKNIFRTVSQVILLIALFVLIIYFIINPFFAKKDSYIPEKIDPIPIVPPSDYGRDRE